MNDLMWSRSKIEKVWRIFDKALPVIAEGVHVPVDELRAFLLDGKQPALPDRKKLSDADRELLLSKISATERLMLRDGVGEGEWLHMTCAAFVADRKLAWRGTKAQARAVWKKYPSTLDLVIVRETDLVD